MDCQPRLAHGEGSEFLASLRVSVFSVIVAMFLVPSGTRASSPLEYDALLCTAEIIILQGDLRRLQLSSTPAHQRTGIQQRLASALGTLGWLCRRYASLHELDKTEAATAVNVLRNALKQHQYSLMQQKLEYLADLMPLSIQGYQASDATEQMRIEGGKIYQRYCVGCHTITDNESINPAFPLDEMARLLPAREFIARMIGGVKGTPEIALHNPLSKQDIAGMYAFLLQEQ